MRTHLNRIGRGIHVAVVGKVMLGKPSGGKTGILRERALLPDHLEYPWPRECNARTEIGYQVKTHQITSHGSH